MMQRVFTLAYAPIDLKNCTIKLKDGGANVLTIKVGEGNLTYTEKKNLQYYRDRGKLDTVREGDEEPLDVKLEFTWEFLKADGGAVPTVEEVLKKIGVAAAWVSSATADTCAPYAVNIEITNNPPCAAVKNEVILLPDFRWEQLDHDVKAGTVSVTGKCNAKAATITRTAVSTNL